jgi:hypothetical protein
MRNLSTIHQRILRPVYAGIHDRFNLHCIGGEGYRRIGQGGQDRQDVDSRGTVAYELWTRVPRQITSEFDLYECEYDNNDQDEDEGLQRCFGLRLSE